MLTQGKNRVELIKNYGILLKIDRKSTFINTIDPIITKMCNLCCPHCWGDNMCGEFLTMENYLKILDFANFINIKTIQYTGGEPLLHPHLINFAKTSKKLNFNNRLRTNFSTKILDNDFLIDILNYFDSIYISLDGLEEDNFYLRPSKEYIKLLQTNKNITRNDFLKYSKKNFEIIKRNLDDLILLKKKFNLNTKIIIATVVQKYNIDKLENFIEFINQYDDLRLDLTQISLDKYDNRNIGKKEFISKSKELMLLSKNIVKIKPVSHPRCISFDNNGNVMLSEQFDIVIGNYMNKNDFARIKKNLFKIIENKDNYYNFLYIPFSKLSSF